MWQISNHKMSQLHILTSSISSLCYCQLKHEIGWFLVICIVHFQIICLIDVSSRGGQCQYKSTKAIWPCTYANVPQNQQQNDYSFKIILHICKSHVTQGSRVSFKGIRTLILWWQIFLKDRWWIFSDQCDPYRCWRCHMAPMSSNPTRILALSEKRIIVGWWMCSYFCTMPSKCQDVVLLQWWPQSNHQSDCWVR